MKVWAVDWAVGGGGCLGQERWLAGASCSQLLGSPLETRASSLPGSRLGIQILAPPPAELLYPESSLPGGPTPCLQRHLASGVTSVGPGQMPQGMRSDLCVAAGMTGALRGQRYQGSGRH